MNDSELVQALRQREPSALRHAYDRYLPSLWRYVYTQVHGDQHLAEDIVSETMLALVQTVCRSEAASQFSNPGGWLRTVAGNKLKDHFRAAARVRHLLKQAPHHGSHDDLRGDPARQSDAVEQKAAVHSAMDQLSEQYRTALEWKYLDKVSVREMAQRWGTTEKAVESILFRARHALREKLVKHPINSAGSIAAETIDAPANQPQTMSQAQTMHQPQPTPGPFL